MKLKTEKLLTPEETKFLKTLLKKIKKKEAVYSKHREKMENESHGVTEMQDEMQYAATVTLEVASSLGVILQNANSKTYVLVPELSAAVKKDIKDTQFAG